MQTLRSLIWMLAATGVVATAVGSAVGCGDGEGRVLDVRTFQLEYLEPAAAHRIIDPYIFSERGGSMSMDEQTGTITVRETSEMLGRIEEVLQRYDRPEPSVRLHFRIIEANGSGGGDPAPPEIEQALPKDVFRFKNYRQVAEAVMTGIEWSEISQHVAGAGGEFEIDGRIGEVREAEGGGTVQLQVGLNTMFGRAFQTSVNARVGQLLVLGTAQPDPKRGALILAVRAEIERP